jgi:hypothetical protein
MATIAVVVGIFGVAASTGALTDRYAHLSTSKQMAARVKKGYPEGMKPEVAQTFEDLIKSAVHVQKRKVSEMQWRALPLAGVGVGGALLGVGAYQDVADFVSLGQQALVVSTIFGLGVLGYQWLREAPKVDEARVRRLAHEFLDATDNSIFSRIWRTVSELFHLIGC